jgi:hypothetical protein
MSTTLYVLTLCLFLGTILVVFGMKYAASAMQARARLREEAAYRDLAERSAAAQSAAAASLASITGELERLAGAVAGVERILKQVE